MRSALHVAISRGTLYVQARVQSLERLLKFLACLSIALSLAACSSLPTDVARTPSHALEHTPDTALARQLQPLLRQNPGLSGFLTLDQGETAFAARVRLIESAEFTIDAQYYIWHDDLTGRVLHNRLLAAADRGVRVRLLLDDLDTAGKDEILRHIDAHPNIEIRLFNPFANREMRAGDFVADTRRINQRMHNKTLTVDGLATIFGGRNIGDEYFSATRELGFGDLDALGFGIRILSIFVPESQLLKIPSCTRRNCVVGSALTLRAIQ